MATLRVFRPIVWTMALVVLLGGESLGQVANEPCDWQVDQPITVRLRDDRRVEGLLDQHSDAAHLWLCSESDGAELASRYPWSSIVEVYQGPKTLRPDAVLAGLRKIAPDDLGKQAFASARLPEPLISAQSFQDAAVTVATHLPSAEPVQSLYIEARLANWDSDAVADGYLVTVYPTTAAGAWTPVRGSLDLWLLGEVWPRPEAPYRYPQPGFQELARASHLVREVDFSHGPATFRLPLRHVHPEAMHSIATYGIVHARLGVNGQGVFEAADSFVRLREASPTRDRLQLYQGQRFYPIERPPRLP